MINKIVISGWRYWHERKLVLVVAYATASLAEHETASRALVGRAGQEATFGDPKLSSNTQLVFAVLRGSGFFRLPYTAMAWLEVHLPSREGLRDARTGAGAAPGW